MPECCQKLFIVLKKELRLLFLLNSLLATDTELNALYNINPKNLTNTLLSYFINKTYSVTIRAQAEKVFNIKYIELLIQKINLHKNDLSGVHTKEHIKAWNEWIKKLEEMRDKFTK